MFTPPTNRAYANQLTGSLHLLDLPANTLFTYLLKTRLPDAFLTSFMHEATHFWCEASDLGGALACLELRVQRDVLQDRVDQRRFLRNVGVVDSTRLLLTPLLEGMALFQEFDALPGSSKVWAEPGFWAGTLFSPLDMESPNHQSSEKATEWLTERIVAAIYRYRSSTIAVARKTEILMQPLSGDPNFYLSGYLAVKQLWASAVTQTPAFLDRDLFLSFLRCWVFQDWILIDYVLDEELSLSLATTLISERLQARFLELAVTDLTKEAADYERALNSKEENGKALIEAMHLDLAETQSAVGHLRSHLAEVYEGLARRDEWENYYFADVAVLKHRQEMMRLALEKVQIEVNSYKRVLVRKGPEIEDMYLAGPAPEGASEGVTDGWIAVYYLPRHRRMLTIAVRDDQPMIWFPGEFEPAPDQLKSMTVLITKVIATEEARQGLHVVCRELARSYHDEDYLEVTRWLPAHVAQIYTRFALSFVREGHENAVQEMLEDKGMYTLLDRDGDLLTALAAISLEPGLLCKGDALRILSEYHLDAEWALRRLKEIAGRSGAQFFLTSADGDIFIRT